jgi:hypothetical protein
LVTIYEGTMLGYTMIVIGFGVVTVAVALIRTGLPWRGRPTRD